MISKKRQKKVILLRTSAEDEKCIKEDEVESMVTKTTKALPLTTMHFLGEEIYIGYEDGVVCHWSLKYIIK